MKASLRSRQVPKHDRGVGRQGHRRCRLRPPYNTWPRASLGNRGRDDIISRGRDLGSLISGLATPARRKVRVAVENIPSSEHSLAGALCRAARRPLHHWHDMRTSTLKFHLLYLLNYAPLVGASNSQIWNRDSKKESSTLNLMSESWPSG